MNKFNIIFVFLLIIITPGIIIPQIVQPPNEYLGIEVGADRTLVNYHHLVQYFNYLSENSPKINVTSLGLTTEDNPFILSIISSSKNMENLNF